jgi:putative transcriptional regulator
MNIPTPQKGHLLIAAPSILNDSSFNRSVILLTEHTKQNTVGFILNKLTNLTLMDLIPSSNCNFQVFQGGPVEQDNLYFVHKLPKLIPESIEIGNGLFWGGDFDTVLDLLEKNAIEAKQIRFFLGYSGWASNQLNNELAFDSWFCIENQYPQIFNEDIASFWKNHLLKTGGTYSLWANAPADPSLN